MEIKAIVDCKTLLGEGPLWDVAEQKIYWIDSLGDRIFRADENGDGVESWSVPQHIGSMALREKGGAVLSLAEIRQMTNDLFAQHAAYLPQFKHHKV